MKTETIVLDANISLEDIGEIELNMAGGILSASIEGLGNVAYIGSIQENLLDDAFGDFEFREN